MAESKVKDKILAIATKLFYYQGYNLTGINQVIAEADIARGSLYNHFPSKTDLLIAYLEQANETLTAGLDEKIQGIRDPKKKILALFDFRIDKQQHNNFGGCPFIKINAEVDRNELQVIALTQQIKDQLKAYISDLVVPLTTHPLLSKEELSSMIYILLEGGTTNASIFGNSKELKTGKAIIKKLLGHTSNS